MLSFLHQADFFHSLQALVVLQPSTISRGEYGADAIDHPKQEAAQVSAPWPVLHADDLGAPALFNGAEAKNS